MGTRLQRTPGYRLTTSASRARSDLNQFYTSSLEVSETESTSSGKSESSNPEQDQATPTKAGPITESEIRTDPDHATPRPLKPRNPFSGPTNAQLDKTPGKMEGVLEAIPFFHGRKDGFEDPEEHIETIDFVVDEKYDKASDRNEVVKRLAFRSRLKEQAAKWYQQQDSKTRADWKKLSATFVAEFMLEERIESDPNKFFNQLYNLRQDKKPIAQYVNDAQTLYLQCPENLRDMFGNQFVAGLADENKLDMVQLYLASEPKITFPAAKAAVIRAYSRIGRPSPFDDRKENDKKEISQNEVNQELVNFFRSLQTTASKQQANQKTVVHEYKPSTAPTLNRASISDVVCHNCMVPGHFSTECTQPQVSYKQKSINRAKVEESQKQSLAGQQAPAASAATLQFFREAVEQGFHPKARGPLEETSGNPGRAQIRMPMTPTILKRGSPIDDHDSENSAVQAAAATRTVRTDGPNKRTNRSQVTMKDNQTTKNSRVTKPVDQSEPSEAAVRAAKQMVGGQNPRKVHFPEGIDDTVEDQSTMDQPTPATSRENPHLRAEMTTPPWLTSSTPITTPPLPQMPQGFGPQNASGSQKRVSKGKEPETEAPEYLPKETVPINMAKNKTRFSVDGFLDAQVTMPIWQLLDRSPQIRAQLARAMASSKPTKRGKRPATTAVVQGGPPRIATEAHEEEEVKCLYLEAWVHDTKVNKTLADNGAVVELINPELVKQLGLVVYEMDEAWTLQLANDGLATVKQYVWVPVNVAGVEAVVRAFILGMGNIYDLLLSKRWMKRVRAVEDHGQASMTIQGKDGVPRVAHGQAARSLDVEVVSGPSVDEWETSLAEDELEKLAEELDRFDFDSDQGKRGTLVIDQDGHRRITNPGEDQAPLTQLPEERNLLDSLEDRGAQPIPALAAVGLDATELRRMNLDATAPRASSKPMSLRSMYGFPTERRPQQRDLSVESQAIVDAWYGSTGITIGPVANTEEKQQMAKRLLYTWRDCFAKSLKEIRPTDLICHSIDLMPNAIPVYKSARRYTPREKDFAARVFPEMEEAGIIMRAASEWGSRTQFPPKKKGSDDLRVVHNFIPLNAHTIKPQWPMHRIEDVIDTIIQPRFSAWFISDASNGYWAIPIKPGDEYKTGIITPHGQYIYLRMGQGLKGACATYSQFGDMVFGPIPKTGTGVAMPSIIGDHPASAFTLFMDDHMGAGETYEALFNFLHTRYFPRVAFGPVYLAAHKTHIFTDSLEMVGFTGGSNGLRPAVKHREKAMSWKEPTTREELDAIIWLTPFLRFFIPGRAEHVLRLKKAYLREEHLILPDGKQSLRKQWVEKESFDWGPEQRESFKHIQRAISENAMSGNDRSLQYHLATDASKYCLGGVLFQLPNEPAGTEACEKHKTSYRIIMFMSFRLEEAETRYNTTEREALAVVRCLAECKCFVMGHKYPTMLYTDHEALETILRVGADAHGRIARWMDRLTEYEYIIHHRPCRSNIMRIADGMSRMPGCYSQYACTEDLERMAMAAIANSDLAAGEIPERSTTPQATMMVAETHIPWRLSKWYGLIIGYMLDGPNALSECGKNESRRVKRMSYRYQLTDQHLLYLEKGGERANCILPDQVGGILAWAHDEHGHFSVAITLHKLRGQWYWPTRTMDVERYCRTCHVCQLEGPRKKSTTTQSILVFGPFAKIGMDYLGPISPTCQATGASYVLIVVDYFSRFVWAKATASADQAAVHDFWLETLAPIYGFPKSIYTDNGSHFVGSEIVSLFESHGTLVDTAPISHPSSVGLIERNVQLVLAQIRRWVAAKGPASKNFWGRAVPAIMPNINSRLLRIHGFTPAEILMGYNPEWVVMETRARPSQEEVVDVTVPQADLRYWEDRRNEIRDGAILALTKHHSSLEAKQVPIWAKPVAGDLVMVRDIQKEKQHGRKLDPAWLGPRLLIELTSTGVSGYVRELYSDKTKRYHLDDLKVYCKRMAPNNHSSIERGAMLYAGFPGQRAVDLGSPSYFS